MKSPIIYLFLFCFLSLSGQDLQITSVYDTPNHLIRDVIIADVDNQGTKEILVSFRDTGLILVYNLAANQAIFQKTENNLGFTDANLAVTDFSGDGKNELIMANGAILLYQSCPTAPFCFDSDSQRKIGEGFAGAGLVATTDNKDNFALWGMSTRSTTYFEKKDNALAFIEWSSMPGGMGFRKHFYSNCKDGEKKSAIREFFMNEAGNIQLEVREPGLSLFSPEEASLCNEPLMECAVSFYQGYNGLPFDSVWQYTSLFIGDTDLNGLIDISYGRNDTIFSGCENQPIFFTGKALPSQSWFFDFDGDGDVDILSLEIMEARTYNVLFYEKMNNGLFRDTIIDTDLQARPDFYTQRDYETYPAYLIIDDLNQDGIKDAIAYGANEVKWYNLAPKEVVSDLTEVAETEAVQIFPNPVDNAFTIQTDYSILSATLYDLQGRLVKTYPPSLTYSMPAESGIYLLHLELTNVDGSVNFKKYQRLVKK